MSASVLIEAVEVEGFGGGGVVTPAFGDMQVTGSFDDCDDGGADSGQVGGAAAGAAGGGVFMECHVTDVGVRFDGPVLADQAGQVLRGDVCAGHAGYGVDGLAGGLPGGGVLPPAGDLDGLAGPGEVQPADVSGLQGAGLDTAMPGVAGGAAGRYLPPGQGLDPGIQQRLVPLHHGDVVAFLLPCQPVQVRPHRMEGVEGHHGTVQVHGFQEFGEVAGLVVLDVDLEMVQEAPAVLGDAEKMDPGAIGAAGSPGSLAIYRHGPYPVAARLSSLLGGAPGTVVTTPGRGRPAGAPLAARARPEQGPGQGSAAQPSQRAPPPCSDSRLP